MAKKDSKELWELFNSQKNLLDNGDRVFLSSHFDFNGLKGKGVEYINQWEGRLSQNCCDINLCDRWPDRKNVYADICPDHPFSDVDDCGTTVLTFALVLKKQKMAKELLTKLITLNVPYSQQPKREGPVFVPSCDKVDMYISRPL